MLNGLDLKNALVMIELPFIETHMLIGWWKNLLPINVRIAGKLYLSRIYINTGLEHGDGSD
jgi:hypothetical protein